MRSPSLLEVLCREHHDEKQRCVNTAFSTVRSLPDAAVPSVLGTCTVHTVTGRELYMLHTSVGGQTFLFWEKK